MTATGLRPRSVAGPTLFARFAYPPNERGLCGPDDSAALLGYAASGVVDGGLRELAAAFDGAWPYLELIAGSNGRPDPLDPAVVEAYWIGNGLSDRAAGAPLARTVVDRFRPRAGRHTEHVLDAVRAGLRPTHCFHVFGVYPWVGLLRDGRAQPAVEVLDCCRIRWGEVVDLDGDSAVVRTRRLAMGPDGRTVALGLPADEVVRVGRAGEMLGGPVAPGRRVALHWDWVCQSLTDAQVRRLALDLEACLAVANAPTLSGSSAPRG